METKQKLLLRIYLQSNRIKSCTRTQTVRVRTYCDVESEKLDNQFWEHEGARARRVESNFSSSSYVVFNGFCRPAPNDPIARIIKLL